MNHVFVVNVFLWTIITFSTWYFVHTNFKIFLTVKFSLFGFTKHFQFYDPFKILGQTKFFSNFSSLLQSFTILLNSACSQPIYLLLILKFSKSRQSSNSLKSTNFMKSNILLFSTYISMFSYFLSYSFSRDLLERNSLSFLLKLHHATFMAI